MTDTAVEQGRQIADDPNDKTDLTILISGVEAASGPKDLFRILPGTIHLAHRRDADVFMVQQGRLRAVVAVVPEVPGQMVIASIYRDEDEEDAPVKELVTPEAAGSR
jgi:hypothetical protein